MPYISLFKYQRVIIGCRIFHDLLMACLSLPASLLTRFESGTLPLMHTTLGLFTELVPFVKTHAYEGINFKDVLDSFDAVFGGGGYKQ